MPRPRFGLSNHTLMLALGAAGVSAVLVGVLLRSGTASTTVSEVRTEIADLALTQATTPGVDDGGMLGPFRISASRADHLTGELFNLILEGDTIIVAARRTTVLVDPDADTISLHMMDVDIAYVAELPEDATGIELDHYLHHQDTYVIGPIPYTKDIRPDAGRAAPKTRSEPLVVPTIVQAEDDPSAGE
ncbi:MAG: hypothetical protein AAF432_10300 [Planctomycetota bacterium]